MKANKNPDKCSNCGSTKSATFWDHDDGTVLCNKCEVDNVKNQKREFDPKTQVREFKRTCLQCKKVWHVLEERENKVQKNVRDNNCYQGTFCCNPGAQLQAKRNVEAGESELDKLKKCPECGSANYKEEVITYDKK